jgi:hypothetical protein
MFTSTRCARASCGFPSSESGRAIYGLDEAALSRRHDPHLARGVAAWLCRRYTEALLREMAKWLGLSRADNVPNLTRRLEARLGASPKLSGDLTEIMTRASAPAVEIHPAEVTRTQVPRKPARPKTRNTVWHREAPPGRSLGARPKGIRAILRKQCTGVDNLPIIRSNPRIRVGPVDRPILAMFLRRTLDA